MCTKIKTKNGLKDSQDTWRVYNSDFGINLLHFVLVIGHYLNGCLSAIISMAEQVDICWCAFRSKQSEFKFMAQLIFRINHVDVFVCRKPHKSLKKECWIYIPIIFIYIKRNNWSSPNVWQTEISAQNLILKTKIDGFRIRPCRIIK